MKKRQVRRTYLGIKTIEALPLRPSFQASYLTSCNQKAARVILKIVILLMMCSCSTMKMKVNGVTVKKRESIRKEELRVYIVAFLGGAAIGYHYKDKIKKP